MSRHPEVLWAQRSDRVYLTVALPDAKDISVKSEPEGLFRFSAVGVHGETFDFNLEFYGKIVPEQKCRTKAGLRNIICSIQKEEKGWWKRLLKSEEKPAPYIKVDWNKWCDEDEEESNWMTQYSFVLSIAVCAIIFQPSGESEYTFIINVNKCAIEFLVLDVASLADLDSDDDDVYVGQDDESSDEEGMLYLPDLEKARGN
ncbi:hypothetical protein JRO89_XS04G0114000 [Xanthoceras sorbifolium]|uniref:Co-chaperone protein p23 n=1 Tax=Xanthoceras sorbifolium TaxID=99658 RepID=A0ABQ8I4W5_9ROSI|nr:hypothetical protein JRO89_XS04G0114000 [Xanthoceras sorbifolium]